MVREKSTRPAPVKKKAAAKPVRRATQRKAKKKPQREMPSWLRYVIAGLIAFLFLAAFFYFFIRPYSYRWKPCYGFKAYGVCMPSGFPSKCDETKMKGIMRLLNFIFSEDGARTIMNGPKGVTWDYLINAKPFSDPFKISPLSCYHPFFHVVCSSS